jgi:hypothetical protein
MRQRVEDNLNFGDALTSKGGVFIYCVKSIAKTEHFAHGAKE